MVFCHRNVSRLICPVPGWRHTPGKATTPDGPVGARPLTSWAPSLPTVSASTHSPRPCHFQSLHQLGSADLKDPASGITPFLSSSALVLPPPTTPQPHWTSPFPPSTAAFAHVSSPSGPYWTVRSIMKSLWDPCTPSELGGPFPFPLITRSRA